MTFQEFRATARRTALAKVSGYGDMLGDDERTEGNLYAGGLCIEDATTWPDDMKRNKGDFRPRWYLVLGNAEFSHDDLETLEERLYEYALSEGICTPAVAS